MENKQCGECTNPAIYFCERCSIDVCPEHTSTHLATRTCTRCQVERCEEMFISFGPGPENSPYCFFCITKLGLEELKNKSRETASRFRRLPLPDDPRNAKPLLEERKEAQKFEQQMAHLNQICKW